MNHSFMTMKKNRFYYTLAITLIGLGSFISNSNASFAGSNSTGEKGAQIYCYMRKTGNDHEVSWNAAYALIKRQTNSMFKTSPRHAAVMIIEAVVDEPNNYPDCGGYLGELFGGSKIENKITKSSSNLEESENRYKY